MTQHVDAKVVRKSITVEASQQRAFEVFTAELGTWWPREYSLGEAEMADFVLEPKPGGRWYELGVDGSQCETGRVLAFDPPERLTIAWHLDGSWRYDPDPEHASEVEVRFIAETATRTRVELEHRHIERHGGSADAVHGVVDSPRGWSYCLQRYADRLTA